MQAPLPLELIISIISFLDEPWTRKDPGINIIGPLTPNIRGHASPYLLTCSLVCRTWKNVCQALICRWVRIFCNKDMIDGFFFLHFTIPHLCKHILQLSLVFSGDVESVPTWIDECLDRFMSLRALELVYWSDMEKVVSRRLAKGIASLLGTISLKRLSLLSWENFDDLLLILPACSTTLEHLTIQCHGELHTPTTMSEVTPSVVRLEALRNMEIYGTLNPFTQMNIAIECPNLESFTILYYRRFPWELPRWIPASIPKLILQVSSTSGRLQFKRPVYPSNLKIELNSPNGDVAWVSECIKYLPFLDHLHQLEINILSRKNEISSPKSTHYEELYRLLQPLQRPTLLMHIIFIVDVKKRVVDLDIDLEVGELEYIRVREVARLEEAFAPLVKMGTFSVQVVARCRSVEEQRTMVVMRCGV